MFTHLLTYLQISNCPLYPLKCVNCPVVQEKSMGSITNAKNSVLKGVSHEIFRAGPFLTCIDRSRSI
jgi:hypothetical protein